MDTQILIELTLILLTENNYLTLIIIKETQ
ncbi:MAG: hypothetical protein JWN83_2683 [Chitinophagaceae bacterium]|nr:hypothetical protein [Chitinophagaceae bacterium]